MDSQTKRCSGCKRELPLGEFHQMGGGRRRSDCKRCRNGTMRYVYVRDREWILAQRKRWYREHRDEHIARQRRRAA